MINEPRNHRLQSKSHCLVSPSGKTAYSRGKTVAFSAVHRVGVILGDFDTMHGTPSLGNKVLIFTPLAGNAQSSRTRLYKTTSVFLRFMNSIAVGNSGSIASTPYRIAAWTFKCRLFLKFGKFMPNVSSIVSILVRSFSGRLVRAVYIPVSEL